MAPLQTPTPTEGVKAVRLAVAAAVAHAMPSIGEVQTAAMVELPVLLRAPAATHRGIGTMVAPIPPPALLLLPEAIASQGRTAARRTRNIEAAAVLEEMGETTANFVTVSVVRSGGDAAMREVADVVRHAATAVTHLEYPCRIDQESSAVRMCERGVMCLHIAPALTEQSLP